MFVYGISISLRKKILKIVYSIVYTKGLVLFEKRIRKFTTSHDLTYSSFIKKISNNFLPVNQTRRQKRLCSLRRHFRTLTEDT